MLERLLDANRNRALEALRVLEDIARFGPASEPLAGECKALRHAIASALAPLDAGRLIAARDVAGDAGCAREGVGEYARAGVAELAEANAQRLTESLRVMEEACKLGEGNAARELERVRYDAYDLAQRIVSSLGTGRAKQWRVCLLLTKGACKRDWRDVLGASLDAGCDAVQVREKGMDGGELVSHVREVVARCRAAGAAVIVNDRADVALAAGADGVHVGQTDMAVRDVRRIAGRTLLVGVSTHSAVEARRAAQNGADLIGIGPMFASGTKPALVPALGGLLHEVLTAVPRMPHLAIGGIGPDEALALARLGARGVAVSGSVCGADDPGRIMVQLVAAMRGEAAGGAASVQDDPEPTCATLG